MGKAAQKCTKCKRHGVEKLVKLHKQYCPYRTCGCKICQDVDRKRNQRALQTRIRRERRTHQIVMEQQALAGELPGTLPVGLPGNIPEHLPNTDMIKIKENEDSKSPEEYSRKYDGGACLPSGSPTAGPTAGYPQLHVVTSISPPPPSSASSASSPPTPHTAEQEYRPLVSTAPPSLALPPRSSPSPSPGVTEDVPALLWYLFSRLCWVSFAQVAASEHHHVSRVLTNALNELMLMVHQYPANNNNSTTSTSTPSSSSSSSAYQRLTPPPLPVNHQHVYTAPPPVYTTPHRHHHHHHHHPYRWPTPPPQPSHSPDNYMAGSDGRTAPLPASQQPVVPVAYSPPPSAALMYSGHCSPTPTQLTAPTLPRTATAPTYTEETTHISQYIRHAGHTVQRCEEHRRLYPGDEHPDYRTEQTH